MHSPKCLPKRKLEMNEWFPLEEMAIDALWPLCLNELELEGSERRWMERSRRIGSRLAVFPCIPSVGMADAQFTAGFKCNYWQETAADALH